MEWGKLIMTLVTILLGGGIAGQLIMFFIKRHDDKKEKRREFYLVVYNKLCECYSSLEKLLLDACKDVHDHIAQTETFHSVSDNNLNQIDKLLKVIKSRERKCGKKGKPSSEICTICFSERQQVTDLYNESRKLQQDAKESLSCVENYWEKNYEKAYSVLATYTNIENFVYSRKDCDKTIIKAIRLIDRNTRELCHGLSFKPISEWDFEDELIKQMSAISVTLQLISKQL